MSTTSSISGLVDQLYEPPVMDRLLIAPESVRQKFYDCLKGFMGSEEVVLFSEFAEEQYKVYTNLNFRVDSKKEAQEHADMFKNNELSFPFKRLFIPQEKVNLAMVLLASYVPKISNDQILPSNVRFYSKIENPVSRFRRGQGRSGKYRPLFPFNYPASKNNSYLSFVQKEEDYDTIDFLVDIFNEKPRLQARRQDTKMSIWDEWYKGDLAKRVIVKARSEGDTSLDAEKLRETLYSISKEATQFKPTLAYSVYKLFSPRSGNLRVLDFSAGWGDRLVAAIAINTELYRAFDPNKNLKYGHDLLIETFVEETERDRYRISYIPFEEAVLEEKFNLVFTSPPFFDFEIYTNIPGQSADKYKTLDAWLSGFLFTSLRKSWNSLDEEGYMVIHITDVYKTRVCEAMCLMVVGYLKGAVYEGVINSVGAAKKGRPMWVFKKAKSVSGKLREKSKFELKKLHPKLHQEITKRHLYHT